LIGDTLRRRDALRRWAKQESDCGDEATAKGICRINDKGELEILEARSASFDFPADFTDKSKVEATFWKAHPIGSSQRFNRSSG